MRTIERLSYSAMSLWEKRPEEFYLTRLSERRSPRQPQEHPAAVGSAFDARVKSSLYSELKLGSDPKYTYETLFEAQVEPQNRDWAGPEGDYVFECYKTSGFYTELLDMLKVSKVPPRFEFEVRSDICGVPFTSKPDCRWVTPMNIHVIHDWKVNGYCSKYPTSPCKSYMRVQDGYVGKQSRNNGQEHTEFLSCIHNDIIINASYLEVSNQAWADQLSLYGWSLDERIGDEDVVLSVHQIVAKPTQPRPLLRVASYRARSAKKYQLTLAERLKYCWDAVSSGYIFFDLSREESDAKCQQLEDTAIGLQTDGSTRENFFNEITRSKYYG